VPVQLEKRIAGAGGNHQDGDRVEILHNSILGARADSGFPLCSRAPGIPGCPALVHTI
jgi:hypothetical protein